MAILACVRRRLVSRVSPVLFWAFAAFLLPLSVRRSFVPTFVARRLGQLNSASYHSAPGVKFVAQMSNHDGFRTLIWRSS
jgi:hypothetical protein